MRPLLRYTPYFIVFGFAAWCLVSFRGDLAQLSLAPLAHSWDLVALAAALSLTNYALRIVRWRMYLARLGYPLPFGFCALTFTAGFAYTLSPGKFGEMVRARYYLPLGIPLADVAAAFFTERLLDLTVMAVLSALLLAAYAHYQGLIGGAMAIVLAVLVMLAALPWPRITTALRSGQARPLRMLTGISSALASTRALLSPGMLASGFGLGLAAWGLEGVGLGVLSMMFGPLHAGPAVYVGIYGIASLAGGLSFLPGGLGSTEAVMTTLLATNGYAVPEALTATLACRIVTLWLAVGLGWVAVLTLRQRQPAMVTPWR